MEEFDLNRFRLAHRNSYSAALTEIKNGRKVSHWMWYIFPQLKGLGHSSTSDYYGIRDLEEAKVFLQDSFLRNNLLEISSALLGIDCNDASIVMGRPDDMKLKSSMTLFSVAAPEEKVFKMVLEKYYSGKPDYRTLKMLGLQSPADSKKQESYEKNDMDRLIFTEDNNIQTLRAKYPQGLHFVVGDTHGEYTSLMRLMDKIQFDPQKDNVYFVGDYNEGGNPEILLQYIAEYYQADYTIPGFHLIRGNHERELWPRYSLNNLPDIIVLKSRIMTYYISHAGMVNGAFELINEDKRLHPEEKTLAYALNEDVACYDAPFRQIIWSRRGLYSQKSHYHNWPSENTLHTEKACIIHGHTPFSQLKNGNYFSYGDKMLFWQNQHIWFAEDLQSFDIDSNIKGKYDKNDNYRGLSCICLEVLDEIAEHNDGHLTREGIRNAENFVFAVPYSPNREFFWAKDVSKILTALPKMKQIKMNKNGKPNIDS